MAINKNHEFEELNSIKCAIVEKNVSKERVDFLKELLEHNKYEVVVQASPPPKVVPTIASAETVTEAIVEAPPETYSVGVSDLMFNATNAIFGRLLKTKEGRVVSLAYWKQKEAFSKDRIPYYENLLYKN